MFIIEDFEEIYKIKSLFICLETMSVSVKMCIVLDNRLRVYGL